MSRSTRPGPGDSTARAFVRVGWSNLLASLHRYATGTLRLAAIDAERADTIEADDLVNTLIEKGLAGELTWDLPEQATDEEVVRYACSKLHGMHSTLRRKAAFTLHDDAALDELAGEGPDALERIVERQGIDAVVRAFARDAEASAYVERMLEGKERIEIMRELDFTAEHADVVRKRILRVATALRVKMNNESEDEPPSSGPRGNDHEPQTTEERQGAPREPHGSAGGAGRRP